MDTATEAETSLFSKRVEFKACSIRYHVAYLAHSEVDGAKTTRRPVPAGR